MTVSGLLVSPCSFCFVLNRIFSFNVPKTGEKSTDIPLFGNFESKHYNFAKKRYTLTVNGEYRYLHLGFVVPAVADFRSMHRKLAENTPIYPCLAILNQEVILLPEGGIP